MLHNSFFMLTFAHFSRIYARPGILFFVPLFARFLFCSNFLEVSRARIVFINSRYYGKTPLFATIHMTTAPAAYKGNIPTFSNIPAYCVQFWQQDKAGKRKKAAGLSSPPHVFIQFQIHTSFSVLQNGMAGRIYSFQYQPSRPGQ